MAEDEPEDAGDVRTAALLSRQVAARREHAQADGSQQHAFGHASPEGGYEGGGYEQGEAGVEGKGDEEGEAGDEGKEAPKRRQCHNQASGDTESEAAANGREDNEEDDWMSSMEFIGVPFLCSRARAHTEGFSVSHLEFIGVARCSYDNCNRGKNRKLATILKVVCWF